VDVLSEVLRVIRLTGAVFFDVEAGSPRVGGSPGPEDAGNVMSGAEHVISVHTVISGSCWAILPNNSLPRLHLRAGDVAVFPTGHPKGIRWFSEIGAANGGSDDARPRSRLICGYLGCDAMPFSQLLALLPPIVCIRNQIDGAGWMTDLFSLALAERRSGGAGGEMIVLRLSELLFVEIVRRYVATLPNDARGWLSGLRDPHVGEALRLIHARPGEDWNLDRLARDVGLSRSTFAGRFTHFVEEAPMHYLARWRLQLAAQLLERPGASLGEAAAEAGYRSEAAFNRAFKKYAGIPPGAWRKGRPSAGA
jgi:AraC-like DNA-binding protein